MNDAEIIKTLEEMSAEYNGNFSGEVLNLIQRQQAEIKKLKKKIDEFPVKVIVGHNSEVHSKTMADYDSLIGDIAAEGIKEVKDRIVEQLEVLAEEADNTRNTYLAKHDWLPVNLYKGRCNAFDEAIEIVKGGGSDVVGE